MTTSPHAVSAILAKPTDDNDTSKIPIISQAGEPLPLVVLLPLTSRVDFLWGVVEKSRWEGEARKICAGAIIPHAMGFLEDFQASKSSPSPLGLTTA
jgi:hypothetical protein